jgi:hypothetical protein
MKNKENPSDEESFDNGSSGRGSDRSFDDVLDIVVGPYATYRSSAVVAYGAPGFLPLRSHACYKHQWP